MVEIKRGDVAIVALPGDYGKPRPAIVVQNNNLARDFDSVIVCPLTSDDTRHEVARIFVAPTPANGLASPSNIMIDKIATVPGAKISRVVGHLDDATISRLNFSLSAILGLL